MNAVAFSVEKKNECSTSFVCDGVVCRYSRAEYTYTYSTSARSDGKMRACQCMTHPSIPYGGKFSPLVMSSCMGCVLLWNQLTINVHLPMYWYLIFLIYGVYFFRIHFFIEFEAVCIECRRRHIWNTPSISHQHKNERKGRRE